MKKIALSIFIILLFTTTIFAEAIPKKINFQGRVTDNNNIPYTGSYSMTFRIYDSLTGGNLLWNETQNNITVVKGLYSILLGSVTEMNILFDKAYYMTVELNSNGEIAPRIPIVPVGYAFRAIYADTAANAVTAQTSITSQNSLLLNNYPSDSFVKKSGDTITGNITVNGILNATYLKGNGSQITNIYADSVQWSNVINKPTSISNFINDSNFASVSYVNSTIINTASFALKSEIGLDTSAADKRYLSINADTLYADWNKISNKPNLVVDTSNFILKADSIVITKVSQIQNDSGFITSAASGISQANADARYLSISADTMTADWSKIINKPANIVTDSSGFITTSTFTNQLANKSDSPHQHIISNISDSIPYIRLSGTPIIPDTSPYLLKADSIVITKLSQLQNDSVFITNAQINNIAVDSLAAVTANKAIITNANGKLTAATVSSTELGYLAGVTSAVQTQIDTKASINAPSFTGLVSMADSLAIGSSRLVVNTNGRVGIGTSNPSELLEVNGGVKIGGSSLSNLPGTIRFTGGAFEGKTDTGWIVLSGSYSVDTNSAWTKSAGNVYLTTVNDSLGVGTTSPTQKVDVNGNVKANYFIGDGSLLTNIPLNKLTGDTISKTEVNNRISAIVTDTAEWSKVNNKPSAISYFTNDSGFITIANIAGKADTPHLHLISNITDSIPYSRLSNTPVIPDTAPYLLKSDSIVITRISQLQNDSNFIDSNYVNSRIGDTNIFLKKTDSIYSDSIANLTITDSDVYDTANILPTKIKGRARTYSDSINATDISTGTIGNSVTINTNHSITTSDTSLKFTPLAQTTVSNS